MRSLKSSLTGPTTQNRRKKQSKSRSKGYLNKQEVVLEKNISRIQKNIKNRSCRYLLEKEVVLENNIDPRYRKTKVMWISQE